MSSAQFVAPEAVPFELAPGQVVQVGPASMARVVRLIELAPGLLQSIVELPADLTWRLQNGQATAGDLAGMVMALSDKGEDLLELVAVAAGLKYDLVAEMLPDRFLMLAAVVLQVNADFFSQAAPMFAAARQKIAEVVPARAPLADEAPAGPTSSTS